MSHSTLSRREFLAASGGAALLASSSTIVNAMGPAASAISSVAAKPPIGIELYALRTELARDLPNTLRNVKQMGYELVEFYAPYTNWTLPYAKEVRKMMDDLGLKCRSTHNAFESMISGAAMTKAIGLNQALGSRYMVVASPPPRPPANGGDGQFNIPFDIYKFMTEQLWLAMAILEPLGMVAGYHNHDEEWLPAFNGVRPIDYIADNTPDQFMLQLDVGTCVKAGADPVAWVNSRKGRIKSVHLKDWAPGSDADEKGFRVLFGEGTSPWKPLIAALESVGGVEFYLMEQEGSRYSEFETAKRCLDSWKQFRKSI